jgi:hypothetical protein
VLEEGQPKVRERATVVTVGGLYRLPLESYVYGWDFNILSKNLGGKPLFKSCCNDLLNVFYS